MPKANASNQSIHMKSDTFFSEEMSQ